MSSLVSKICAYSLFGELILIYPLYVVMFADREISPLQISILLIAWSVTAFALEIPSGVIADKYSRRLMLVWAQVAQIACICLWLFFPGFIGYLLGVMLWGVNSAFTSGTFQALVYDELKSAGSAAQFTKVNGYAKGCKFAGGLLAGVGAAAFAGFGFGYDALLVASIFALATSAVAAFLLPEAKRQETTHETEFISMLKDGIKATLTDFRLVRLVMFMSLVQAVFGTVDEYWGIFAQTAGLSLTGLGLFFSLYYLSQAAGAISALHMEKWCWSNRLLILFVQGSVLAVAAIWMTPSALLLVLAVTLAFSALDTAMETKLQEQIERGELRATITSVNEFVMEVMAVGMYFGLGALAKIYSYRASFVGVGVLLMVVAVMFAMLSRRMIGRFFISR